MSKTSPVPITKIEGIQLTPTKLDGLVNVNVEDYSKKEELSWDRYVRLKAVSDVINAKIDKQARILDVGGFDGALAFFLPEYKIDLIDPASTGADLLDENLNSLNYETVVSVDVLEHITPDQRAQALIQLASLAKETIVLNYPHIDTKDAQKLVWQATGNKLIEEHCKWDLPETKWVLETLEEHGFKGSSTPHSSLAIWLGQYISLNSNQENAAALNKYLIQNHHNEPFTTPLYDLVFCQKF